MSIIPFLYMDPWEYRGRRGGNWDNYGLGITPADVHALMEIPRRYSSGLQNIPGEVATGTFGKDGFKAKMDVTQFQPNEISVKTVDNSIVVEGKHEEREDDHGFISRHFVRKYSLPQGYDPNKVVTTLSSDGVLTIKAPPPDAGKIKERVVPIQHVEAANSIKDKKDEKKKK